MGDLWDDPCGSSDCDSGDGAEVLAVLVVTDVLVLLSSAVTGVREGFSLDSEWEFVEQQSSSFSKKRSFVWSGSQEEMSFEGTPVKAPPTSKKET